MNILKLILAINDDTCYKTYILLVIFMYNLIGRNRKNLVHIQKVLVKQALSVRASFSFALTTFLLGI
jgi:hypothetical protein